MDRRIDEFMFGTWSYCVWRLGLAFGNVKQWDTQDGIKPGSEKSGRDAARDGRNKYPLSPLLTLL